MTPSVVIRANEMMGDKNQTRVILIVKKIGSLLESSMGVGMEGSTMVRVLLL